MRRCLVVGIGNTLRRDDGVGAWVVDQLGIYMPTENTCTVHQLTPELVETLANVDIVIFVDASRTGDSLRWSAVEPRYDSVQMGHAMTPGALLAWTRALYHHCPTSWLLEVPGQDFGLGEGLSAATSHLAESALLAVLDKLKEWGCTKSM